MDAHFQVPCPQGEHFPGALVLNVIGDRPDLIGDLQTLVAALFHIGVHWHTFHLLIIFILKVNDVRLRPFSFYPLWYSRNGEATFSHTQVNVMRAFQEQVTHFRIHVSVPHRAELVGRERFAFSVIGQ